MNLAQPVSALAAGAATKQTTDEGAETAEDAEAAEALTIFLDGTQPQLASEHQLLHLAQNIVPHSWGCSNSGVLLVLNNEREETKRAFLEISDANWQRKFKNVSTYNGLYVSQVNLKQKSTGKIISTKSETNSKSRT